jgi:hypothetical protein
MQDHLPPDTDSCRLRSRDERRHVDNEIMLCLGSAREPPAVLEVALVEGANVERGDWH